MILNEVWMIRVHLRDCPPCEVLWTSAQQPEPVAFAQAEYALAVRLSDNDGQLVNNRLQAVSPGHQYRQKLCRVGGPDGRCRVHHLCLAPLFRAISRDLRSVRAVGRIPCFAPPRAVAHTSCTRLVSPSAAKPAQALRSVSAPGLSHCRTTANANQHCRRQAARRFSPHAYNRVRVTPAATVRSSPMVKSSQNAKKRFTNVTSSLLP